MLRSRGVRIRKVIRYFRAGMVRSCGVRIRKVIRYFRASMVRSCGVRIVTVNTVIFAVSWQNYMITIFITDIGTSELLTMLVLKIEQVDLPPIELSYQKLLFLFIAVYMK